MLIRAILRHPGNRGARLATAAAWFRYNVHSRIQPGREVCVSIGDASITAPLAHPVVRLVTYVRDGRYDHDGFRLLESILQPGDCFLDIGANIGAYAAVAAERLGSEGTVIAVEPAEEELRFLRPNLDALPARTVVVTEPVADRLRSVDLERPGLATQYLVEAERGDSRTTTVDDIVRREEVDPSRCFVKIDVEGWEPAVILGSRDTLAAGVRGILLEARGLQLDRCPVPWSEAVSLLEELGYRFAWPDFDGGRIVAFPEPPPESPRHDYLAARPQELAELATATRLLLETG